MKHIVVGTNRPNSNSMKVALFVQKLYAQKGEQVEIIDLANLELNLLGSGEYHLNAMPLPPRLQGAVDAINSSEGLILVVPEYNGALPGVLKLFIDHWKFPDSFVARPVCFIGLGAGMWGGLRPIEHLSQIFAYRNAYQFPVRVFMREVHNLLKDGEVVDPIILKMLQQQVDEFPKFCRALKTERLDANSLLSLSR